MELTAAALRAMVLSFVVFATAAAWERSLGSAHCRA